MSKAILSEPLDPRIVAADFEALTRSWYDAQGQDYDEIAKSEQDRIGAFVVRHLDFFMRATKLLPLVEKPGGALLELDNGLREFQAGWGETQPRHHVDYLLAELRKRVTP